MVLFLMDMTSTTSTTTPATMTYLILSRFQNQNTISYIWRSGTNWN